MNRILMIIIACICFNLSSAQSSINDYKYVIVERQFHFQGEENQYNLNEMVRFNFRKYGFKAIIEGEEFPADLKANYCLALQSEVRARGTFKTVATIVLKDCENNEVFISEEGITKEKNYDRLYYIAIGKAFESFKNINYVYKPNQDIIDKGTSEEATEVAEEAKKEIQELKAEIKELKEEKKIENGKEEIKILNNDTLTTEDKVIKDDVSDKIKGANSVKDSWVSNGDLYFKFPFKEGFLMREMERKEEFKFQKTSLNNIFTVTINDLRGVGFYNQATNDYTIEYENSKGKRIIKKFNKTQ